MMKFKSPAQAGLLIALLSLGPAATGSDTPRAKTGFVDVGTAKLYYEESGQGTPVIMIHGGLLDSRNWDSQFEVLAAAGYRAVRYDARRHGRSTWEAGAFSHHEDLNRLMEGLGIAKAVIMGLSMGGYAAIDFALAHPDKVIALIPVSPGLTGYEFKDKEFLENEKKADAAKSLEEAVEMFLRSWTDGPRRTPGQVDPEVREKSRRMQLENTRNWKPGPREERLAPPAIGRLSEIRIPTLTIVGELDMPGILEIAGLIGKNVPGARSAVIAGAAHLVNMEKPGEFNRIVLDFLSTVAFPSGRPAQVPAAELYKTADGRGWKVVGRRAAEVEEGGRKFVRLDEGPGSGLAWLDGSRFFEGTIEFDVRGKDAPQKSFVGVAFHGLDEDTFEAVYFRPFNFRDPDPAKAGRSVQYVSHPGFTWQKLRAERPGEFEKAAAPVPDPNGWFHVRVTVKAARVSVSLDDGQKACLDVDRLGDLKEGLVGFFVGNGSGGDFAGLKITPAHD
jgi:3-oxoadipate enol-lactonase